MKDLDLTRLAPKVLTLVCHKCMRSQSFGVRAVEEARTAIAKAGWVQRFQGSTLSTMTICPRCPQTSEERASREQVLKANA